MIEEALNKVRSYVESEGYKGYDPYDTLLSPLPFHWFGKWGPVIATQFQKRNPINIRPLIGINKGLNPKGIGILLHTYSLLHLHSGGNESLANANFLFQWLKENISKGYSGSCWGYNFPWATPLKYLQSHTPSSVVTGINIRGIHAYYIATGSEESSILINDATKFILNDLERYKDDSGCSISYTPVQKDICYNASLLACEAIAREYSLRPDEALKTLCIELVEFVISRQHPNGRWDYSEDLRSGVRRIQTDFHQGYILESIHEISGLIKYQPDQWRESLSIGLEYYKKNQFFEDGRSYWRVPTVFPVDIHNQSQGIITFTKLRNIRPEYRAFADTIAEWTCRNMQGNNGAFYYRNHRYYKHRIPYIRWSQAWMMLALTILTLEGNNKIF